MRGRIRHLARWPLLRGAVPVLGWLLLMSDPWTPPEHGIPPTGVHRPSTAVLYGIIVFVAYAGPKITGLVLAAISLYILDTVRIILVITLLFGGPPSGRPDVIGIMPSMEECERQAAKWRRDFGDEVEVTCQLRQKSKAVASS